jgi:hypothetical protein
MDRTSDLQLATYLLASGSYTLKGIEGVPGRRLFVFDREIPGDLIMRFQSSPEKRLLDVHRSLKASLMHS